MMAGDSIRLPQAQSRIKRDPLAEILKLNEGRDPERLGLKYRATRSTAFAFLRGTKPD